MAEHPNAQLYREGFEAFLRGDIETVAGQFADDAVWHSGGRNKFSGDHKGKEEILSFMGQFGQELDSFEADLHAVLADDDHTVALVNTKATRGDNTIEGQSVFIYHITDGKITEAWAVALDQYKIDEFWG